MRSDAVHVELTDPVLTQCQQLAEQRIAKYGRPHRDYGVTLTDDRIRRINRIGVLAEFATAFYLQRPWSWDCDYTPTSKDRDLGDIEVRGTDRADGCLITHDDDWPATFVLVTLAITGHRTVTASLQGWLPLKQCNVRDHWRTDIPHPAYMTPQSALHPMRMLALINN